ncbi:MAG: hypothetical protein JWL95_1655 [Gemmatimonadetes bacterium]|nr:hypothetical protein [Gemmatimonadota bacterium]
MPSAAELTAKWQERLTEWRSLGVRIDGEKVAAEVLEDLRALVDDDVVTLQEASRIGGYSVDHLQRMVAAQTITNVGRKHAPRMRRADVPTKPGHRAPLLPGPQALDQLSPRRRIVADAQAHRRP